MKIPHKIKFYGSVLRTRLRGGLRTTFVSFYYDLKWRWERWLNSWVPSRKRRERSKRMWRGQFIPLGDIILVYGDGTERVGWYDSAGYFYQIGLGSPIHDKVVGWKPIVDCAP